MHICILTQYYLPEIGAPQARLSELANYFIKNGHKVTVLTAMPNYPTGKVFPDYGGFFKAESINGVKVIRGYVFPSKSLKMIPRLWNYFSFVISSIIIGLFKLPKCDALITESPPLFLGISGYILSKIKNAKWIFNVSDLWPESAVQLGVVEKGLSLNMALALEKFCYNKAKLVTGQSREIIGDINERFPEVRTYRLSNGVNVDLFSTNNRSTSLRDKMESNDKCIAIYAGLHGVAQGLEQIINAAKQLKAIDNLMFVLVGDGPEKEQLVQKSDKLRLSNIRFLDPYTRKDMPTLLASADIALVPLKISLTGAVPSKLYEAMSTGLPIVLIAEGEAANIVTKAQAGFVVKPGDGQALINALQKLSRDPSLRKQLGKNARKAVIEYYNRDTINCNFVQYLEKQF